MSRMNGNNAKKRSNSNAYKRNKSHQARIAFNNPQQQSAHTPHPNTNAPLNDHEFAPQEVNEPVNNATADTSMDQTLKVIELEALNGTLEKKVANLEEVNRELRKEIEKLNISFLDKIQEKASQAQKLVNEKIEFYEKKKNEEVATIKSSVYEEVASNFLDPIILLQSIVESSPSDPVIANYLQGFKMLLNQFDEKLENLGIDEINVNVGDEFNELYMEAFDVLETNEYPPNIVVKVLKKGFVMNETKVLKHTMVVVSKALSNI